MGLYFIAAGSTSDHRLDVLDTSHQVSDFKDLLSSADLRRLVQHFSSDEPVFLWGGNERSRSHLEKARPDDYVVDFKNQVVAHVFKYAFMVDTGSDRRLQHHFRWDEGRRATRTPRSYRYVYFLRSPQVPVNRDKRFFLNAFGRSRNPHFFDGQKYLDDHAVSAAMQAVGATTLEEFLGLSGHPAAAGHAAPQVAPPAVGRVRASVALPDGLVQVVEAVGSLRQRRETTERDHENLVAKFLEALGYRPAQEIRFQRANIDICVLRDGSPLAVIEVKRDWSLSRDDRDAVKQAYAYAHDSGAPFVIVTNCDYYAVFDRRRGLTWDANFVVEFRLSALTEDDLDSVEALRSGALE
jgi:hypothetical protein